MSSDEKLVMYTFKRDVAFDDHDNLWQVLMLFERINGPRALLEILAQVETVKPGGNVSFCFDFSAAKVLACFTKESLS